MPVRLNRRSGECRLAKFGPVRSRWSRALGGEIRNATVLQDDGHWFISFCVDDGRVDQRPNGLPPVGIDRGVTIPVAASNGQCFALVAVRPSEQKRLKRLQ